MSPNKSWLLNNSERCSQRAVQGGAGLITVETEEGGNTVGGDANWYSHYGEQ